MPHRERRGCEGDEQEPDRQRPLQAGSATDQPRERPGEEQGDRAGQEVQAALGRAGIEAVVDEALHAKRQVVRSLDEIRDEDERAEHREAGDERRQVREQHLPHDHHPHVHHRLGNAQLGEHPGDEEREGEEGEPERSARRPAPILSLRQRDEHADEATGEQRRPDEVDARRRLDRRLRHVAVHEHGGGGDVGRADDEEPAPREVIDDQPREHDPEAPADAEDRGDQPDRDSDLLARELVADDPVAEREDCRAAALQCAPRDQHPDVPGQGGAHGACQEEQERDQQHALLAVLVTEFSQDRRGYGRDEQEDRQHPGDPLGGRVEVALQRRQRRDHHRLLQGVCDPGEGQDRERDVVVLPSRLHRRNVPV